MSEIVPYRPQRAVVPRGDVIASLQLILEQRPDLISFDPADKANELLAIRCAVDAGVPETRRDGWRGTVVTWWVGAYDLPDKESGELATIPSLVLIDSEGNLCRLTGEAAISSWAQIVRIAGAERCRQGLRVKVSRRKSSTSMGSYWQVLPDA